MLEIGTANGGSLYLFCEVAAPDAHLVSVDLPPRSSRAVTGRGSSRVLDELKTTVDHDELVDSEAQEGYGIGLVNV